MSHFPNNNNPPMCGGGGNDDNNTNDAHVNNANVSKKRHKADKEKNRYPSFSNSQEFLSAIEGDDGNNSYIIAHTNLKFEDIPSVTGVQIVRQFFPPRKNPSPSHFWTNKLWDGEDEIMELIIHCLDEDNILFCLPDTIAVFSVTGTPADSNLSFDIYCCPNEDDGKFMIEFRRTKGDAFIMSRIFRKIKRCLVEADQLEEDDYEDPEEGAGNAGAGGGAGAQNNNNHEFNFDDLIN